MPLGVALRLSLKALNFLPKKQVGGPAGEFA